MRKSNLAFIAILMSFVFLSCQKELSFGSSSFLGNFTATIDSTQWEATTIKEITRQGGTIVITGKSTNGNLIVLRVVDSGVHTYSFYNVTTTNVATYTDAVSGNSNIFSSNQWALAGNYGTLQISSIDTVNKIMSGTFSFRAFRQFDSAQHNITNGIFTNISYSTSNPPPSATDTFRVKVDGTPFTYSSLSGISTGAPLNQIGITALQGSVAPVVGLTLASDITNGAYTFEGLLGTVKGMYNPSTTLSLVADSGNVQILEHNTVTKRLRGNFDFKATPLTSDSPKVALTEGYFSIIYN